MAVEELPCTNLKFLLQIIDNNFPLVFRNFNIPVSKQHLGIMLYFKEASIIRLFQVQVLV